MKETNKPQKDFRERRRIFLRYASGALGCSSFLLLYMLCGTSDYRDSLKYEDDWTREKKEAKLISEENETKWTILSLIGMGIGSAGLCLTEKKQKNRCAYRL